jgi:hypothetical protein
MSFSAAVMILVSETGKTVVWNEGGETGSGESETAS